jgi:hypothetical protein
MSSSDHAKGQVVTPVEPSAQRQEQQPLSGTPVPTQPWSAPLVILGLVSLQGTADLLATYALPWLSTLFRASSEGRFLAAAVMTKQLLSLGLTAGSLALWCRWRRTTITAVLLPGVKQPRVAVGEGWHEGSATALTSACAGTLFILFVGLVPLFIEGPDIWTPPGSMDVAKTIVQSRDPLAIVMWGVSRVILAPLWGEVFYR